MEYFINAHEGKDLLPPNEYHGLLASEQPISVHCQLYLQHELRRALSLANKLRYLLGGNKSSSSRALMDYSTLFIVPKEPARISRDAAKPLKCGRTETFLHLHNQVKNNIQKRFGSVWEDREIFSILEVLQHLGISSLVPLEQ
ncbi:hypothetical protein GBA52_016712 [Prunus armeniaca]|nr:hypothetical protein GBA52_016712 [Prunus armeniaca]